MILLVDYKKPAFPLDSPLTSFLSNSRRKKKKKKVTNAIETTRYDAFQVQLFIIQLDPVGESLAVIRTWIVSSTATWPSISVIFHEVIDI